MGRTILRALVGSRAHGLADESSDSDYREVFVEPTSEILKIGGSARRASWLERDGEGAAVVDDVAWEVGHFLSLATKCNPAVLEVLAAPEYEADEWGRELRGLMPALWNPAGVRDAFIGYGLSQQKKLLAGKDARPGKFACAYLRTLISAHALLTTGELRVRVIDPGQLAALRRYKSWSGGVTAGEVIDACALFQRAVEDAAADCKHEPDVGLVNDFLLRLRRAEWS